MKKKCEKNTSNEINNLQAFFSNCQAFLTVFSRLTIVGSTRTTL